MASFVYGLQDPRTGEIRYVGKTERGVKRLREHKYLAERGEATHKAAWVRSLLHTGRVKSLEQRQRLSDALRGRKATSEACAHQSAAWTPERRAARSALLTGTIFSAEHRANLSAARLAYVARRRVTA